MAGSRAERSRYVIEEKVGILVPLRLPSAESVETCLFHLIDQLRRDPEAKFQVCVGYDSDDAVLRRESARLHILNTLSSQFPELESSSAHGLVLWVALKPTRPFAACAAWNALAKAAYRDGNAFFLMLGDDVKVVSDTWFQQIMAGFQLVSQKGMVEFGVGCVAAVEENAPAWPCFPVLHRWHLHTFGDLFPVADTPDDAAARRGFYNQDAEPFLWELYRRLGLTAWTSTIVLRNAQGGVTGGLHDVGDGARFEPVHVEWRLELLHQSLRTLQTHLPGAATRVTIDVAVPSSRLDVAYLTRILDLEASPASGAEIRFLLVVDRAVAAVPEHTLWELRALELARRDVRIRVNAGCLGAPASRTRAAGDCHSEWILFLDEDVVPDADLLDEYVKEIRRHAGDDELYVRGFVGLTRLDFRRQQSTMAVHLAESSLFWHISEWCVRRNSPAPWGVTANLLLRWWPGLRFDASFPATGGWGDVDVCIAANSFKGTLLPAPRARVVQPWWDGGKRWSLWKRVFGWGVGDGMLFCKHPKFTYLSFPNVGEVGVVLATFLIVGAPLSRTKVGWCFLAACVADVVACSFWVYLLGVMRDEFPRGSWLHFRASLESTIVRRAADLGRLCGFVGRGEVRNVVLRRFDRFLGLNAEAIFLERALALLFFSLFLLQVAVIIWLLQ